MRALTLDEKIGIRPVRGSDFYGMGSALRILWLLPLLLVWTVFFGIMYFIK